MFSEYFCKVEVGGEGLDEGKRGDNSCGNYIDKKELEDLVILC